MNEAVKYGYGYGMQPGDVPTHSDFLGFIEKVEGAGFDSFWMDDHIAFRGNFLESLAASGVARDLPNQQQQRGRILVRRVDTNAGMARAGPAGHQADPGSAGELARRFRHVGGAGLVAARDQAEGVAAIEERVEDGQVALAGNGEDGVYPVNQELVGEDCAAGTTRRGQWSPSACRRNASRSANATDFTRA